LLWIFSPRRERANPLLLPMDKEDCSRSVDLG
jgi:hypothetical protein